MPAQPKSKAPVSHAHLIHQVTAAAAQVVNDQDISELNWLPVLKAKPGIGNSTFSDGDLRRFLREAKAIRDGRKDFTVGGDTLDVREEAWLWDGIVMRQATNMVVALPKVGKTRLMLAMLSAFLKGRGEFADIGINPGPEKLLLLGPDQSERSWGTYLKATGLLDKDDRLSERVIGLTTAETGFLLDEYWFTKIEEKLREHGPLVVLLDSYAAATRGIVEDENKSTAAVPLSGLHNLVMAYGSTLIVIHHANKSGSEGDISKLLRGSTALGAVPDNLIAMQRWKEEGDGSTKKYELSVSGRAETAGTPLVGFEKHSAEWLSFGLSSEAKAERRNDTAYNSLTVPQLAVLDALVTTTRESNSALSVRDVAEKASMTNKTNWRQLVTKILNRLQELGFAEPTSLPLSESKISAKGFKATAWAVVHHLPPDV